MKRSLKKNYLRMALCWTAGLSFAVASLGTIHDIKFHSTAFMDSLPQLPVTKRRLDDSNRILASDQKSGPSILYFPLNKSNYERIKGKWKIYNFIDHKDHDNPIDVQASLELIGNGQVKLDEDSEQLFWISFLSEENTIAIFKRYKDGFEILEAKKIITDGIVANSDKVKAKLGDKTKSTTSNGIVMSEVDLVLEKALLPNVTNAVLEGSAISGSASIKEGALQNLHVSIQVNGQSFNCDVDFAEINDGGQFSSESNNEAITGILTNNGQHGFRIRFATGPMNGAILNFISQTEFDKQQELSEFRDQPAQANVESQVVEQPSTTNRLANVEEMVKQKTEEQDGAQAERNAANEQVADPNVENISPEEMAAKIQESGFEFDNNGQQNNEESTVRDIASK